MEAISVVIITYNEEDKIARCIDSVKEIADEIVVLDSFSSDATETIAKQKGARFFQQKFEGHIQQKNRALTLARNDWVLSLDADELLSPAAIKAIKAINNSEKMSAFSFKRLNNYCGEWITHGGWYPDRKVRLFRKSEAIWGGINPHDKIQLKKNAVVCHLPADILHYSYASIEEHIAQSKRFSEIAATELFKSGQRSSLLKLVFSPVGKFVRDYFFRLGFLDGYNGIMIAYISAKAVFWKYVFLYQLNQST